MANQDWNSPVEVGPAEILGVGRGLLVRQRADRPVPDGWLSAWTVKPGAWPGWANEHPDVGSALIHAVEDEMTSVRAANQQPDAVWRHDDYTAAPRWWIEGTGVSAVLRTSIWMAYK